ncbi:MAG TPA: hypothetical protein DDY43_07445 [Synechococcales bacterium UBA10510]|nr:hypothetical protein [Synechococcales bacterium UBA10510]
MVADSKMLQVSQVLAAAQDSRHRHQQQVPGRYPRPTSHPGVRDRIEVADQIEIVCSKSAFGQVEAAIPPA